MKEQNKSKSKVIKFLNGKTFYVVLCICFIAVGVAAWAGMQSLNAADPGETDSSAAPGDTGENNSTVSLPQTADPDDGQPTDSDRNDTAQNTDKNNSKKPTVADDPVTDAEEAGGGVAAFFIKPVLGEIIKNFSDTELQYSMTYGDMRLHKALDIAADEGTPVTASGEGKVTAVYTDPLMGSTVEIDHGNGITAKYCGLNPVPTVKEGDTVDSSTQLGTIDVIPCESVEQRHLHLEFYLDGNAVSPEKYMTE